MTQSIANTSPASAGTVPIKRLTELYINGVWTHSSAPEVIEVVNPTTEQVIATVPAGTADDVERAVAAAKSAFEHWSLSESASRAAILRAISEGILARGEELALAAATDVGTPVKTGRFNHVTLPATTFANMADTIEDYEFETRQGALAIVREPVGVVACITPWNYPVHQIAAKVAPAIAAGCCVVVKPSEVAPLSAYILAEIIAASSLPPGVFNMISGLGQPQGRRHGQLHRIDQRWDESCCDRSARCEACHARTGRQVTERRTR
jgi:aldehyde dehydrogenase (NAD+)